MLFFVFLTISFVIFLATRKRGKKYLWFFAFVVVFSTIAYIPVALENSNLPFMGTYGSDALFYYVSALAPLSNKDCLDPSGGVFICLSELSLRWSIDDEHYNVVLLTIFLHAASATIMLRAFERNAGALLSGRQITILYFLVCNPLIIWCVLRGVKEPLFIFLVVASGSSLYLKNRAFKYLIILSLAILAEYVKPLGSAAIIFPLGFVWAYRRFPLLTVIQTMLTFTFVVTAKNTGILNIPSFQRILAQRDTSQFSSGESMLEELVAPIRFVLGPGPHRAFEQLMTGKVFQSSTTVGDIYIFLGVSLWWVTLCIILINLRKVVAFSKINYLGGYLLGVCLFYILTYSFISGGTVDTRHRAVIYVFTSYLFLPAFFTSMRPCVSTRNTVPNKLK